MQTALEHGAGRMSALLVYDRRPGVDALEVRHAAAALLAFVESKQLPKDLHILVALGVSALAGFTAFEQLPTRNTASEALPWTEQFPTSNHDVVVQIAASCEADRVRGLRVVEHYLKSTLTLTGQHMGGRILNALEHFGFRDGVSPDSRDLGWALGTGGQSATPAAEGSGSWLFFLLFKQDLEGFSALTDGGKTRVMGKVPSQLTDVTRRAELEGALARAESASAARQDELADPTVSHFKNMQGQAPGMLRRGFPTQFIWEGSCAFGLAFLATAVEPSEFKKALDRMRGTSGAPHDRLVPFVRGVDGGSYFCPPSAAWLAPSGARQVEVPPTIRAFEREVQLRAYEVTASFLEYMLTMKDFGIFEGEPGYMKIVPEVQTHLDAVYRALAGGSDEKFEKLKELQARTEDEANAINKHHGEYLTFS